MNGIIKLPLLIRKIRSKFQLKNFSFLYETQYGIKFVNKPMDSDLFRYYPAKKIYFSDPEKLVFCFDALKDKYTLLGQPLIDSPHYNLVKNLYEKKDIKRSEYVRRSREGSLDLRSACSIFDYRFLDRLKERFARSLNKVRMNCYEPLKVAKINGNVMVYDGKHTAILCMLLGKPIKCMDISPVAYDSFFYWVYKKMLENPNSYSRHITFFKWVYGVNQCTAM